MSVRSPKSAGIDAPSSAVWYLEPGVGVRESREESAEEAAVLVRSMVFIAWVKSEFTRKRRVGA